MPTPWPPPAPPPDDLPGPGRFTHLHPDSGACLMETASLLATGRFTDSPPGTHPVLAALARVINDSVDDAARAALRPLAADLAHAYPPGRTYGPWLIGGLLDAAQRARPRSRRLRRRRSACRRRIARITRSRVPAPLARAADALWWRGPGHHHLEHALRVLVAFPDADQRLVLLLTDAVAHAAAATRSPSSEPALPLTL
ncbi:hypothetical protein [Streptomyces sporangiiformans]|uniref:Uncharacterized protein n=1 Tax=Streptomyces sporangiiformans TaxID=2315329 RepID=A0A505DJM5_9ACTN|nr:hypothetical protein [Streptomyces sporangiiformans]TPQ17801.1 hypothetical protein FGD71_034635 [Streptomyces sporangiiformans]